MIHLKNAVQALDRHIEECRNARTQLVELLGESHQANDTARAEILAKERAAKAAPSRRTPKQTERGRKGGRGATAPEVMAKVCGLTEPFTTAQVGEALGWAQDQARQATNYWLKKGVIKAVSRGEYRRLAKCARLAGEMESSPRSAPAQSGAESPQSKPEATVPSTLGKSNQQLVQQHEQQVVEAKLTPYSPKGIELGGKLPGTFTVDQLAAQLPNGKQQAYYFVAQWRNRQWIEKLDYDVWRRTITFGN